ncbi:hypothetical protein ACQCT5_00360 [Sutcliffiella halmapala]
MILRKGNAAPCRMIYIMTEAAWERWSFFHGGGCTIKTNYLLLIVFGILFLSGCSFMERNEKMQNLVAEDENKYAIFVAGKVDTITFELLEEHSIHHVQSVWHEESLQFFRDEYAFLEIDRTPTFIVFDHKKIVYRTHDQDELIEFIKDNKPN